MSTDVTGRVLAAFERLGWIEADPFRTYAHRVGFTPLAGQEQKDAVHAWRRVAHEYGQDSGPARGALLDVVRLAWGREDIWVRHLGSPGLQKWEACMGDRGLALGITELLSLVAALEGAPS